MLRRSIVAVASALLVLAGPSFAQAAIERHVSQTVTLSPVAASKNYPNPGSTLLSAGIITGTIARRTGGATVQKTLITGHPTSTKYTFRATSRGFYALGTITTTLTGTAILQHNGSARLAGKGRYTGGTGLYRNARGTFTFAGTIPPAPKTPGAPAPTVVHVVGTISY
jgi:hypothetical protein